MTTGNVFEYLVPAVMRSLRVLIGYVEEMERRVEDGMLTEETVIGARLAGDMLPFAEQIRLVSENAKNGPARLSGKIAPVYPEADVSVGGLKRRLANTLAYVATYAPHDFDEAEERAVPQTFRQVGYALHGGDYLREVLLPNFYFHVTVVHATLRQLGIPIGKADFLSVTPRPTERTEDASTIRFLTRAECRAWRGERGLPKEVAEDPTRAGFEMTGQAEGLQDAGTSFGGGLVEVVGWTINDGRDPTEELRRTNCDMRSLADVPGVCFAASESEAARTLLLLVAWQAWLGNFYAEDGNTVVKVDGVKAPIVFRRRAD